MIRQHIPPERLAGDDDFAWRGTDVSRLEAFTDGAFAFALTLLVVAGNNDMFRFESLQTQLRGFLAFAATFAVLTVIWYRHYQFFRRYGLRGPWTVFLNAVLVFLVLFYVYPLKFLFGMLFDRLLAAWFDVALPAGAYEDVGAAEGRWLILLYSTGYAAVYGVFLSLHRHALQKQEILQLTPVERHITREGMAANVVDVAFGFASCALVLALPSQAQWAGLIYFGLGPAHAITSIRGHRSRDRLKARLAAEADGES